MIERDVTWWCQRSITTGIITFNYILYWDLIIDILYWDLIIDKDFLIYLIRRFPQYIQKEMRCKFLTFEEVIQFIQFMFMKCELIGLNNEVNL